MEERIAKASKVPVISVHSGFETETVAWTSFGYSTVVVTVGILSSEAFLLPFEIAANTAPPSFKHKQCICFQRCMPP